MSYLDTALLEMQRRLRVNEVNVGRDLAMSQHEDCFEKTSDTTGRFKMANV